MTDDDEQAPPPDNTSGGLNRAWLAALIGVVAAVVATALIVFGSPAEQPRTSRSRPRGRTCGPDVNICISGFRLVGVDGQLPTLEQFRDTLAVNDTLVLTWQMRATPLAYATMAATDDYADFTLFAGCVGGGQMTIDITTGRSFRGRMAIRCDGSIGLEFPVAASLDVGKSGPTRLGPYLFETTSYGKVIDAEFFVMGFVPLVR